MPKPCSLELRERVVDAVKSGASRREAAEWFDVSASSAIKWMQRRRATGSIAPKPSGGSISPLEAHAAFLFVLIARQPDQTLDEIVEIGTLVPRPEVTRASRPLEFRVQRRRCSILLVYYEFKVTPRRANASNFGMGR